MPYLHNDKRKFVVSQEIVNDLNVILNSDIIEITNIVKNYIKENDNNKKRQQSIATRKRRSLDTERKIDEVKERVTKRLCSIKEKLSIATDAGDADYVNKTRTQLKRLPLNSKN